MKNALHPRRVLPPLIPFICSIAAFELSARRGWIPTYLLPAPSQVFFAFLKFSPDLLNGLASTGLCALVGFVLSVIIGIASGVILSSSPRIQRVFYPYAVFFQTVPIISIAPLLVIWFGYGIPTVIASAFIAAVFPIVASTLDGILGTDPALLDLFTLYGAGKRAKLWKLRLPYSLPSILTGSRISAGLAVIGAIVGEFIAGGGLGGVIDAARTRQRIELVFAAVLSASALGLVFFLSINAASFTLLRHWHPSERE